MAPAKPTNQAISAELANVVREIYNSLERDQLTVNYARKVAEEKLRLDDGFLKAGDWKAKSKQIILDTLNEVEGAEPDPSQITATASERATQKKDKTVANTSTGKKKRQPKATTSAEPDSELNDVSKTVDVFGKPAKTRKRSGSQAGKAKAVSGVTGRVSDGSENAEDRQSPEPTLKQPPKHPTDSESELSDAPDQSPKPGDDESELSEVIDEHPGRQKQKPKTKAPAKPKTSQSTPSEDNGNDANDSSSELSSVIDDAPPPRKRKRKPNDAAAPPRSKGKGAKSSTAGTDLSPDEAQIKLLQSQLLKCGVRKVWAFEFKKRGDDTPKAKIRRLKEMLAEVGMTGRFSEAKAREIREMRELQADLQDVMQGEKNWGVASSSGRGSRRKAAAGAGRSRSLKEDSDVDDVEEGEEDNQEAGGTEGSDDDDGGAAVKPAVRRRGLAKRRADLAFLDDESESE